MINSSDAPVIGAIPSCLCTPGSLTIGPATTRTPAPTPANYLQIQNDTATAADSPWHVKQIDQTHYEMPNATASKGWQYLGVFLQDVKTGARVDRANGAVWTFSDPEMIQHISTSDAGQAVVNILKAGTCTLTVKLRNMISTLVITAV